MPEVMRIGGIKIEMYFEDHGPPHFHVIEAEYEAKIDIMSLEILRGNIRARTYRKVKGWAEENRNFLLRKWEELQ